MGQPGLVGHLLHGLAERLAPRAQAGAKGIVALAHLDIYRPRPVELLHAFAP